MFSGGTFQLPQGGIFTLPMTLKGRELERGINLKMKVKLAAKLLIVAWTLMKTREQFNATCFTA